MEGGQGRAAFVADAIDQCGADSNRAVGGPDFADNGAFGDRRGWQGASADEFAGANAPAGASDGTGDALSGGIGETLDWELARPFFKAGVDHASGKGVSGR